jgi:hypothetical protein
MATFSPSTFFQTALKCGHQRTPLRGGRASKKSNQGHCRLLRARRNRPHHRRAAEQRDELAAFR